MRFQGWTTVVCWLLVVSCSFAQGTPGGPYAPPRGAQNNGAPQNNFAPPANAQPNNEPVNNGSDQPYSAEPPRLVEKEQIIPCPFPPLSPPEQDYLNRMLQAWEQHSAKVERYRCNFERWEYDPIFGPRDPKEAKTYARGKLQYAAPDKGMFRVESVKTNMPPAKPGEPSQWIDKSDTQLEHWVCDGQKIFQFDYANKKLIERVLPPQLQGKSIVDGPLPFFFGAKAERMLERYWLRVITPEDVKNEYWLEAIPKYRRDAQNFKMVHVILDQQDFYIKALQVFDPAFNAEKRPIRTVFTFNQREANFSQGMQFFLGQFYQPKTPLGWKFVSEPYAPDQAATTAAAEPPAKGGAGAAALKLIPFQPRRQ